MKQIIIVRKDYPDGEGGTKRLRRGKEIAQACHASGWFMLDLLTEMLESNKINKEQINETLVWVAGGQTKVCLQVHSEKELDDLYQQALDAGLRCNLVTDAGRTEFNGVPTKTCLSIGPNNPDKIDKITGHLKLY